jgi:hypothetical protein
MGWSATLSEQLRYIIGDTDEVSPDYSDTQLNKFLGIGARFVVSDLIEYNSEIYGPYSIDTNLTADAIISPDPMTSGAPVGFANLILLKAAFLISGNELRRLGATAGWKIQDDKSTIDGTAAIKYLNGVKDYMEERYQECLDEFKKGQQNTGYAIMTPYASASYAYGSPTPSPWFGYTSTYRGY